MVFSRTRIYNLEEAIHGMRHALLSYGKEDSEFFTLALPLKDASKPTIVDNLDDNARHLSDHIKINPLLKYKAFNVELCKHSSRMSLFNEGYYTASCRVAGLGPNDLKRAQALAKSGATHRKFLRQIMISVVISAPIYWWKEFDTYKINVTRNSTSTMHKITSQPISRDMFEQNEPIEFTDSNGGVIYNSEFHWNYIIETCETLRKKFCETKDEKYWKELIQLLPSSLIQTSTITMNYENVLNMCSKDQRRNHKLTEWRVDFMKWVHDCIPFSNELLFPDLL